MKSGDDNFRKELDVKINNLKSSSEKNEIEELLTKPETLSQADYIRLGKLFRNILESSEKESNKPKV